VISPSNMAARYIQLPPERSRPTAPRPVVIRPMATVANVSAVEQTVQWVVWVVTTTSTTFETIPIAVADKEADGS